MELSQTCKPSARRGLRSRGWLLAFALVATTVTASAQPADAPGGGSTEAAVVVFNRTITVLRAPLFGVAPADRARRAEDAIRQILRQPGAGVVTVSEAPQGRMVLVDGQLAFPLGPEDADRATGQSLDAAAREAAQALEDAIAATREARDRTRLFWSALWSGVATLVFLLLVGVALRTRRWVVGGLTSVIRKRALGLRVAGYEFLPPQRQVAWTRFLVSLLTWVVLVLITYEWLSFSLNQFPYTRPWGGQLEGFLFGLMSRVGTGIVRSLPDLVTVAVIVLLARAAHRLVNPFFDRVERGEAGSGVLDVDTAQPTRRLVVAAIWIFAIVMAYPYLPGSSSEAFKGMSVLIGLMVSLGGSSLFGQAASGLILRYSRMLRVGEYVRITDHEGTVTELGTFTTRMRTGLGEEVTLPNSLILGNVTKNYSRAVVGHGYVVDTTVTIGYDTPWRQVEAMLIEAAHRTPGILETPAPRVFQTALSDFYPEYRLVCQAIPKEPRPRAEVLASLHGYIQDVFNEHGVQIMSPHYLGDPAEAKVVPPARWYTRPAAPPPEETAPDPGRTA
jgi:small-conductance mechanosensitive channel